MDEADTGDGTYLSFNLSFYTDGEVSRRSGLDYIATNSGTVFTEFRARDGKHYRIYATVGGTVEAVQVT